MSNQEMNNTLALREEQHSHAVAEILGDDIQAVEQLSNNVKVYREALAFSTDEVTRSLIMAKAVSQLPGMLKPMLPMIRSMQGSPLGFRTDRDKDNGYGDEVLLQVCTVALLSGCTLAGNQFNIIGANFYHAKNGMENAVLTFPGLDNWDADFSLPQIHGEGTALVSAVAKWTRTYPGKDGEEPRVEQCEYRATKQADDMDLRIPIKVNKGQGHDAILGKAKRKLFARVYEKLTGNAAMTVDESGVLDEQTSEPEKPLIESAAQMQQRQSATQQVEMEDGDGRGPTGEVPDPRGQEPDEDEGTPRPGISEFVKLDVINAMTTQKAVNDHQKSVKRQIVDNVPVEDRGPIFKALSATCNAKITDLREQRSGGS